MWRTARVGGAGKGSEEDCDRLQTELHPAHQVLGVEHADDGLRTAGGVVHGDAGVLLLDDLGDGFLQRHVAGKRKNIGTRNHDLAHGDGLKVQRAVQQLLLQVADEAVAVRGGDAELELFRGVHAALADVAQSEGVQNPARRGSHGAGDRTEDGDEDIERPGDGERHLLGLLQGDGLGNDLTEDDVQVGDGGECEDGGERMGVEERSEADAPAELRAGAPGTLRRSSRGRGWPW